MLAIRLQRRGRKNDPSFRVIVCDSHRAAKTGSVLEVVGNYDPRRDAVELKADRIKHWMGVGAQVSDTVHNILVNQKLIDAKKRNVLPKKTVPKKEETEAEPSAAAAPEAPAEAPAAEAAPAEDAAPDVPAEMPAAEAAPAEESGQAGEQKAE